MTQDRGFEEPIDDQVPVADAVEQRQPVADTAVSDEELAPTAAGLLAAHAVTPPDVDPTDWLDQQTDAGDDDAEEWDTGGTR